MPRLTGTSAKFQLSLGPGRAVCVCLATLTLRYPLGFAGLRGLPSFRHELLSYVSCCAQQPHVFVRSVC